MSSDVHQRAALQLASVAQRYTAGRRALVDALASAGRPLTLPDVLEASPALAQSSAYRNLAVLEQAGVVHRVVTGDFARFELDEALTAHHHHLVCSTCGAVTDIEMPERLERAIDKAIAEVADRAGFVIERHQLDLVGRCRACAHSR